LASAIIVIAARAKLHVGLSVVDLPVTLAALLAHPFNEGRVGLPVRRQTLLLVFLPTLFLSAGMLDSVWRGHGLWAGALAEGGVLANLVIETGQKLQNSRLT